MKDCQHEVKYQCLVLNWKLKDACFWSGFDSIEAFTINPRRADVLIISTSCRGGGEEDVPLTNSAPRRHQTVSKHKRDNLKSSTVKFDVRSRSRDDQVGHVAYQSMRLVVTANSAIFTSLFLK